MNNAYTNYSLASAIRGPVLLITLGILFAIDHFGSLRFQRSWPVLIIVFGIMKLFERSTRSHSHPAGVGMPTPSHPGGSLQ